MTIQDTRTPLERATKLVLKHGEYTVRDVIGNGGSCLAYSAELAPEGHENKIGILDTPVIIKEFYPVELAQGINRDKNGALLIDDAVRDDFDLLKCRFETGAVTQKIFCISDSNHTLPSPLVDTANGTVYSVSVLARGQTLSDCRDSLSMLEKADVFTSLCNAVGKLHNSAKLHLDLKPSNIFVFEKDNHESRRIALFDFDTVISVDGVLSAAISYSEGWSPYEQVSGRRDEISYATDVYAIGAVCYWLYTGKKVCDKILNDIVRGRFDFLDEISGLYGGKGLKKTIADVLFASLKRVPAKRVPRVEDLPL